MEIEFGSDFHYCTSTSYTVNSKISENGVLLSNGRQAIQCLINEYKWKRIWVPTYFCYTIIHAIKQTGIAVAFYNDSPLADDNNIISEISFEEEDCLLRMNYFGLRTRRDNSLIPVPVIEDHSHDLLGDWAQNSNADWCVASLRKTIPIPEGGILWSPRKQELPRVSKSSIENELNTYKRISAMLLKTLYLSRHNISKDVFRKLYIETEEEFENLPISSMSSQCELMMNQIDLSDWYDKKNKNWRILKDQVDGKIEILVAEDLNKCNPFSLIIKCKDKEHRENIKKNLIKNQVYSAVLWDVPSEQPMEIVELSNSLLSIHCDGRYDVSQMMELKHRILNVI